MNGTPPPPQHTQMCRVRASLPEGWGERPRPAPSDSALGPHHGRRPWTLTPPPLGRGCQSSSPSTSRHAARSSTVRCARTTRAAAPPSTSAPYPATTPPPAPPVTRPPLPKPWPLSPPPIIAWLTAHLSLLPSSPSSPSPLPLPPHPRGGRGGAGGGGCQALVRGRAGGWRGRGE